jgi:hypothetical protein
MMGAFQRADWWLHAGVSFLLLAIPSRAGAQTSSDTLVPAGAEYQFHGAFRGIQGWLYGSRYRSLWATPVAAPVLPFDLHAAADTTPRVGMVWVWSPDGALWEYRPLDRDLLSITPPAIRKNLLPTFIQDLNASRHPGAAPVVRSLAGALGVAVPAAQLVRLDDTTAAPHADDQLGYLVAVSTEGRTTAEVLDSLRQGGGREFDALAYLRERLLDTYLGSVDDRPEEWRWTRTGPLGQWAPAPRDRERAFAKYDGLLAGLGRGSVAGLVNFGVEYQERLGVMAYQRTLDRQLLSLLDWAVWDSVTSAFQAALTDSVIAEAVAMLPPEYLAIGEEPLAAALRARRDLLPKAARGLYRLVNQEAAFFGTPGADTVTVTRQRRGGLDLVFQDGFRRTYAPGETDAIALYLGGGADQIELVGPGLSGPLLDVAWHEGLTLSGARGSGQRTSVYGGGPRTGDLRLEIVEDTLPIPEVEDLDLTRPPPVPLHGTDVGPNFWFDVNSDVGVLIGGGVTLTTYRMGYEPYYKKLRFRSGYATAVDNYAIEVNGEFRRWRSRQAATLDAGLSEIIVLHFFGFGNTTPFTQPANFYLAQQRQLYVYPAWNYKMTPHSNVAIGPIYKHVRTDTLVNSYISQTDPYGVPEFAQLGVQAIAAYDTRDAARFTRSGWNIRAGGSFYPVVFEDGKPFGTMQVSAATYVTPPALSRITLALRATGRLTMGNVPVHEAAFVGGSTTVRGYESGRYAGQASVYFNNELRIRAATVPFVVPWQLGVVGIADLGRVFNVTDDGNVWHGSVGGGLWFSLPNRSAGGVITIVGSPQGSALWLSYGFMY